MCKHRETNTVSMQVQQFVYCMSSETGQNGTGMQRFTVTGRMIWGSFHIWTALCAFLVYSTQSALEYMLSFSPCIIHICIYIYIMPRLQHFVFWGGDCVRFGNHRDRTFRFEWWRDAANGTFACGLTLRSKGLRETPSGTGFHENFKTRQRSQSVFVVFWSGGCNVSWVLCRLFSTGT